MGLPFFGISEELLNRIPPLLDLAGCAWREVPQNDEAAFEISQHAAAVSLSIAPNVPKNGEPIFEELTTLYFGILHWHKASSGVLASLVTSMLIASGAVFRNHYPSQKFLFGPTRIFSLSTNDGDGYVKFLEACGRHVEQIWPPDNGRRSIDEPTKFNLRRSLMTLDGKIEVSSGPRIVPSESNSDLFISIKACGIKDERKSIQKLESSMILLKHLGGTQLS